MRVVVLVLGLTTMLEGILDVLGVVLALDVLSAGAGAVGLISGALGAGGLLGAGIAISLVGRHRLLTPMLLAALVVGLGIGVVWSRATARRRAARVPRRRYRQKRVRRRRPDDAPTRGAGRDPRPDLRRPRGGEHGGPRARDARGPDPRPAARLDGRARRRRPRSSPPQSSCSARTSPAADDVRHRPRGGAGAHPRDPDVRAAAGHDARAPGAGARPHARPARRRDHPRRATPATASTSSARASARSSSTGAPST